MRNENIIKDILFSDYPDISYSMHHDIHKGVSRYLLECYNGDEALFRGISRAIRSRISNVEIYVMLHPSKTHSRIS